MLKFCLKISFSSIFTDSPLAIRGSRWSNFAPVPVRLQQPKNHRNKGTQTSIGAALIFLSSVRPTPSVHRLAVPVRKTSAREAAHCLPDCPMELTGAIPAWGVACPPDIRCRLSNYITALYPFPVFNTKAVPRAPRFSKLVRQRGEGVEQKGRVNIRKRSFPETMTMRQ